MTDASAPLPLRLLTVLLVWVVLLSGCASLNRAHDALLLLGDIQAGAGDSRLKRRTDTPEREPLRYRLNGHIQVADRYHSGQSHRGSLVLIHGFTVHGRRDPRLVEFAHSLARSGFEVLVPELPGLKTMSVGTREIQEITTALRFATRGSHVTGVAAVSFAAGPTLMAAAQPDLNDRIAYVVVLGGYYDLVDAIRYATTGSESGETDAPTSAEPRQEGKWLLLMAQLHHLEDPVDRHTLKAIARRKLRNPRSATDHMIPLLGPDGRAVYRLIVNRDPGCTEDLLADLPVTVRQELLALDLARQDLSGLTAELLLIHGRHDNVIPASHSRRLASAVKPGQAQLYLADGLNHVDMAPGLLDSIQLWRAARALLWTAEKHASRRMEKQSDVEPARPTGYLAPPATGRSHQRW